MKKIKLIVLIALSSVFCVNLNAQKKIKQPVVQKNGCSSVQPIANVFLADTIPGRGLADNYYLWDNGKTIYVKFLSGSKLMQDKVKTIAKEWEKYANIKFKFVEVGNSHIRINLDDKGGHNSTIGTLALSVPNDERTMNFDTTDFKTYAAMYRTVLHEFGHALGLLHEHYSPVSGIKWNKEAVYNELKKTQGWSKEMVDANLFQQFNQNYTNGTSYDSKSIMHYPIKANWTTNAYSVNWNNKLSDGDIAMIKTLYPVGERENEVPRFVISNFTSLKVQNNDNKQGVSIYPSFTLSTAGKSATVYFVAFFYDEDGNAIQKTTKSYSISGVTATFKSFIIAADKTLNPNKNKASELELFIPYNELPVIKGKNNFQVEFKVYMLDGRELKLLYQSKRKVFNFMKS
ncbi:MAG TPA: M12 family metallopeptidase [Chitinophagaceae bacterium]|nr:hypothetical protein [Chitinophagaceae bacterium]MCC6635521.1 hypothetical protein [Chitinophagaceae bacterium]HMZ45857.1 M12 family metallopeptidase [Chitinophagaceae bacterium]HNE93128.1 M12 family metallopeptidase [Chitinophagaceae bacterium]HNF29325.1 M12 family metallopeptidase [Chitinophagaceae bacterium]